MTCARHSPRLRFSVGFHMYEAGECCGLRITRASFSIAQRTVAFRAAAPARFACNANTERRLQLRSVRRGGSHDDRDPVGGVLLSSPRIVERDPVPVLALRGFPVQALDAVAELTFAYGEESVHFSVDRPHEFQTTHDNRLHVWPRRYEFESAAREVLAAYGLHLANWPALQYIEHTTSTLCFTGSQGQQWARFLDDAVPVLRASGWRIEIDPTFPYSLIDATEWDAQIEASQTRWFEFDLGIDVGQAFVAAAGGRRRAARSRHPLARRPCKARHDGGDLRPPERRRIRGAARA